MNWTDVAKALPAGAGLLANILMPGSGAAVSTVGALIAHALGVETSPDAVVTALVDPAAQERLLELQETNRADLQKLLIQQATDLARIAATSTADLNTAIVGEVSDARKTAIGNAEVYKIAKVILWSFSFYMLVVTCMCALLVANGSRADAGIIAAVAGLIGAITGYFAANAQTVVNFLFGGSLGARSNADSLGASARQAVAALGKAANAPESTVPATQ